MYIKVDFVNEISKNLPSLLDKTYIIKKPV